MYLSFPYLTQLSNFFRGQTISCDSLLNFPRKMCKEVLDHFGFFLNYGIQSNWSSNTLFIAAFMFHAGFSNNFILSLKIFFIVPFLEIKYQFVWFICLSLPTALLNIIALWFYQRPALPLILLGSGPLHLSGKKFQIVSFSVSSKTSCCSNHLLSLIF